MSAAAHRDRLIHDRSSSTSRTRLDSRSATTSKKSAASKIQSFVPRPRSSARWTVIEFTMRPLTDAHGNQKASIRQTTRATAYRGVHTMAAELTDARGDVIFADVIGVHIA